jgi:hypothetical protein
MMMRNLVPLLLALAVASAAPRVHAQPADDVTRARELFVEGAKLAESGNWEAARERFAQSLKLKHAALTLYNLGIAQQETGHLVDAVESYRAFLAQPVEPATQGFVGPVRAVLTKLEARVAHVAVEVRPADLQGVVVRIDGREVPRGGGPWMVDPGPHEIVASVPGHGEVKQTTSVTEGVRTTLSLTLTVPPASPAPAPSVAVPAGLALGGLALFVAGQITFAVGASHHFTVGAAKNEMIAGNVLEAAGALFAGAALIVLLKRPPAPSPKAAVAPWISPQGAGVTFRF